MKTLAKYLLLLVAVGSFAFTSCQKDDTAKNVEIEEAEITLKEAQETSFADMVMEDVVNIGESANSILNSLSKTSGKRNKFFGECAVITKDIKENQVIVTIDFGEGCEDAKGNIRKGKLIVKHNGKYWDKHSVIHHYFEDYYFNGNKIEGTKSVERVLVNKDTGFPTAKVVANFKIVLSDDRGEITRHTKKTREWLEGFKSGTWEDNVIRVSGNAHGKNSMGYSYNNTILEPLIFDQKCEYPLVQGVKELENKKRTLVIKYGDGECDDLFTITKGENTREILWSERKNK